MITRRVMVFAILALVAVTSTIAYRVGRARADGAPTMDPLTYGGVVDDGGRPMEGTHSVTVRLWDMPAGGTAACTTVSPTTPFVAGRFRVTMDATCTAAVQTNPNLWAEVIVDSTTLPRSRVGAVPYAIEAARAAAPSGSLATRLAAVETASRPHQVEVGSATGLSGVACSTTYQTASCVTPLTITATATGTYRIAATALVSASMSGGTGLRIGAAGSVSFMSQPEALVSWNTVVPVIALARLEAGRMYTFSLEYRTTVSTACGVSIGAISPLVVEQLN